MSRIKTEFHPDFERLLDKIEEKYGFHMLTLDGIGEQLNFTKFSKKFYKNQTNTSDVSVDGNANKSDKSVISHNTEMVKPYNRLDSYHMLWKKLRELDLYQMADEVVENAITGRLYINDFHGYAIGIPYCFNYSTLDIMVNGINGLVDELTITPPKYLSTFIRHVEQFISVASNATLGATGLADLLLTSSIYMENILEDCGDNHVSFASEEECWKYLNGIFETFIYTINQRLRVTESPFVNISVYDDYFLDTMLEHYINPHTMKKVDKELVKRVQVAFLTAMNTVMSNTVVTFPVITACFSLDEEKNVQDKDFLETISLQNSLYYFINLYGGTTSTLSSCCRLRSDVQNEYFNSFGAGGSKIGSLGVVTINLPRIAYDNAEYPSKRFEEDLRTLVRQAFYINYTKRLLLKEIIAGGKQPIYTLGFIEENKQYATLGFNGFNEALEILGYDPLSDGVEFGKSILQIMNEVNDELGRKYKVPVNLEQIPAENVSIKLAKKDRYLGLNEDYALYSNQFIPLTTKADMLDRIKLQGEYDSFCSGGSILHINDSADETSLEYDMDLTEYIFKQGVIYFARNKNLQVCKNKHVQTGRGNVCKTCGAEIESNWLRVVGFITQVNNWIKERREIDYPNREFYDMDGEE